MTETQATQPEPRKRQLMNIPEIRYIPVSAGPDCLLLGLRDFSEAPKYGLFFGAVYAIGGWLIIWLLFQLSMPYFAYPLAMGFALIAPFVAVGTYEVSRRLEIGQPLSWKGVLGTVWQQKGRNLGWMALITGFAFFIWVDYTAIVFLLFFGLNELEPAAFWEALTTTMNGLYFVLLGNVVGGILAAIVFSVTVISLPLLLERDIDFATAMTTSVRAVTTNPLPMAVWAAIIAICLLAALITVFIALPVILPVLGHATWHMYRKVVGTAVQPSARPI